mgnify:CR=1 FL=1
MSFTNHFWAADWDGLYRILASGEPPLAFQLLAVNTIFLVIYILRRATTKHRMQSHTVQIVQALLLITNIAVVFQDGAYQWLSKVTSELLS